MEKAKRLLRRGNEPKLLRRLRKNVESGLTNRKNRIYCVVDGSMVERSAVNRKIRVRSPPTTQLSIIMIAERLYNNTKHQDRKRGRKNNLTRSFIRRLIQDGCVYCGNKTLEDMSVDRVRNDEGHMQHNVVPACVACNRMRGSVPFFTWLVTIKIMKQGFLGT